MSVCGGSKPHPVATFSSSLIPFTNATMIIDPTESDAFPPAPDSYRYGYHLPSVQRRDAFYAKLQAGKAEESSE